MSETGGRRVPSRVWFIVATVAIAILVVASGALVATLASSSDEASDAPASTTQPKNDARPLPANQPPATLAGPNPTSCDQIYSPEMFADLEATGMPLNDPSVEGNVGARDDELRGIIESHEPLNCSWGYAGDYGLTTSVTRVAGETAQSVLDRMATLGYDCAEESGGTRCLVAFSDGGNRYGESHFVRDGIWLATAWVNFAPKGYTPDIIATLWPDSSEQ